MRTLLATSLSVSAMALASFAFAEFSGPAPLAWRWYQQTSVVPGAPVVQGDVVYAAVGRRVYALDRATGNQLWRFPAGEPLAANFKFHPLIVGNTLIATTDDRNMYALNLATGAQQWTSLMPQSLLSAPVVTGSFLTLPLADNSILAMNVSDGQPAWTNPTRIFAGIKGTPIGFRDRIILADQGNKVYSIDTGSKRVIWEQKFNELAPNVQPTVVDDTLYYTAGNFVVGLNPETGRPKGGQFAIPEPFAFPALVNSTYVVGVNRDGRLIIVDRSNPRRPNRVDLGSPAIAAPAFVGKFVAVNTANGSMNLVDPASGKTVWNYILRPAFRPAPGADGRTPPNYMTATASPIQAGTTLILPSRDGSILAFDAEHGVDLTPPMANLVFPQAGSEINPRYGVRRENQMVVGSEFVVLYFQLDDLGSGLNLGSVKVTAGGREMESIVTREGFVVVDLGKPKNSFATSGRQVFLLTASDWVGNAVEYRSVLTFDSTVAPMEKPGTASSAGGAGGPARGIGAGGA